MKKLLLASLIFIINFEVHSQEGFKLGFRAAPNFGWADPSNNGTESLGSKVGYSFGLFGDFNFAENYAFHTGIYLTQVGGNIKYPSSAEFFDPDETSNLGVNEAEFTANYIEVPISLKLKTNEIGYMTYYGLFGTSLMFNYDANAEYSYTSESGGRNYSNGNVDYSENINLVRFGLLVGVGAEYNISGNTSLVFGVSYNNGFTDIFDDDIAKPDNNGNALPNQSEELKGTNNFLSIDLGVLF